MHAANTASTNGAIVPDHADCKGVAQTSERGVDRAATPQRSQAGVWRRYPDGGAALQGVFKVKAHQEQIIAPTDETEDVVYMNQQADLGNCCPGNAWREGARPLSLQSGCCEHQTRAGTDAPVPCRVAEAIAG